MALTAAEYQVIQRAVHNAKRVLNVQKDGNDANGGLAPSAADAFLTIAHASAVASPGDLILVGPGIFNEGTNPVVLPAQCKLRGAGEYLTTILSNVIFANGACIQFGNDAEMEDLTVSATAGVAVAQCAIGFNSVQTPFSRAIVRRCTLIGPYDVVVLVTNSATPTDCLLRLYDCHLKGAFDTLVTDNLDPAAWNVRVECHNCDLDILATDDTAFPARCVVARRGLIIVNGGRLKAECGNQLAYGVFLEGSPSRVELNDVSVVTVQTNNGTANDFVNIAGGVLVVNAGTKFDRTKVLGTFTLLETEGTAPLVRGAGFLGDFKQGSLIRFDFNTKYSFSTSPTPQVKVYRDNNLGEFTTGVTLTVDVDSRKGLNRVEIDTSVNAITYPKHSNFYCVITQGMVDGASVVNTEIASFALQSRHVALDELMSEHLVVGTLGEYFGNLIQTIAKMLYPSGTVYFVSKTGNDANDGKSWTTAKLTINAATSIAFAGDVILIGPGTYVERVIDTNKLLHLYASGSVTITGSTIQSPVIQIGNGSTVDGIAIVANTNETTTQGIILGANSIVRGCQITATSSAGTARGLAAFQPGCLVQDTIITVPAAEKAVQAVSDTLFDHCQFTGTLSGGIYSECSPASVNTPGAYLVVGSRNPSNTVGSSISLEMFQREQKLFLLTVTNNLGTPISLVGKTLRFVVETTDQVSVGVFDIEQSGISLSGGSNEIANVTVPTSKTNGLAAGTYEWRLWDVTTTDQEAVLLFGSLTVMKAVKDVV